MSNFLLASWKLEFNTKINLKWEDHNHMTRDMVQCWADGNKLYSIKREQFLNQTSNNQILKDSDQSGWLHCGLGRCSVRIKAGTPATLAQFFGYSSVPPKKCRQSTSVRPRPLPFFPLVCRCTTTHKNRDSSVEEVPHNSEGTIYLA
jgi:hypothetical protein